MTRLCERSGAKGMILTTEEMGGACRDLARLTASSSILIVSELDSVMPLVLTNIRDASGTRAAASAHQHLLRALPSAARQVLADGFAIGPRTLTVSRLARTRNEHCGSLRRRLIREGLPAPSKVVRLIRASFAIELLITSTKSTKEVAGCLGVSEAKGLRRLLTKTFGVTTSEVRADPQAKSLEALLKNCGIIFAHDSLPARNDAIKRAVSDQVRRRRRMLMMSRAEVARGAHVELAVIGQVERGILPSDDELLRIGRVVGMDAPYVRQLLLGSTSGLATAQDPGRLSSEIESRSNKASLSQTNANSPAG